MAGHRGRASAPVKRSIATHKADAQNQVWMWDITYLNGPIKGEFFYLYLISDLSAAILSAGRYGKTKRHSTHRN